MWKPKKNKLSEFRVQSSVNRVQLIRKFLFTLSTVYCLLSTSSLWAGLRAELGEVELNDFPIGEEINIRELADASCRVLNTGDTPIILRLGVVGRDPGEYVKEGYEKIPDTSWIKLSRAEFTLAPGEEALSEITIHIPNDSQHLGKKYQAYIWAQSHPVGEITQSVALVGVKSRILINVAKTPFTRVQRKRIQELKATLGFQVVPDRLEIEAAIGKKINVKKHLKKSFKIVNPNDEALRFKIEVIPRKKTPMSLPEGWGDPPEETRFLDAGPSELLVSGNSIIELSLVVKVPKDEKLLEKKFLFIVKIELQGFDVPVSYYARLFVKLK